MGAGKGSSSSKRVRNPIPRRAGAIFGKRISKPVPRQRALELELSAKARVLAKAKEATHLDIPSWNDGDAPGAGEYHEDDQMGMLDVLEGAVSFDVSHAGEDFADILDDKIKLTRKRAIDSRTRRDRKEQQRKGFEKQMDALVRAYMLWQTTLEGSTYENASPHPPAAGCQGVYHVQVVDVFRSFTFEADLLETDANITSALLRHGLVPSAPFHPAYAITVRALELYRTAHLRSPHLAIEPFVKALSDLHRLPYRRQLHNIFSNCYDLYLRLREEVQKKVEKALDRGGTWRRRNACPACTYRLEGEQKLTFDMLVTMDGNDSLKRIIRREIIVDDQAETGQPAVGPSKEREDSRVVYGDYYLSRNAVDRWDAEGREEAVDAEQPAAEASNGKASGEGVQVDEERSPCQGRWHNMEKQATARMWGIFDESGIFLSLCRHGFTLMVLDLVRSGEKFKYALSTVEALLDAYGPNIGGGYDIGCKFGITLSRSNLGPRARALNYRALVGAFHGHAHNRLCQLSNLATYMEGMGLEDLEGCERLFSKSNALASSLRYASAFHRQQKIVEFLKHMDSHETAQNLSKFIVNNYKQALATLQGKGMLRRSMAERGISGGDVFVGWLAEEREYLKALTKEPIEETMQMDYYQKLVDLNDWKKKIDTIRGTWMAYDAPSNSTAPPPTGKRKPRQSTLENQLRHANEKYDRTLDMVQELERSLGVEERWTSSSDAWKEAAQLVSKRRYQKCLDELEALIVARMFELTKMNMLQTGYKLRKHIAKALQARSHAIKGALERYNAAAAAMSPPREKLTWDTVVEYAFLADFDLLRDTRQDIRKRPWAQPTSRMLMDQYFKMERAREEIKRLNIEIKRIVTHIEDEDNFLRAAEETYLNDDHVLAFHIGLYRHERTRFNSVHLRQFSKLSNLPGFKGSLVPGKSQDRSLHACLQEASAAMLVENDARPAAQPSLPPPPPPPSSLEEGSDSEDEDDDDEGLNTAYSILSAVGD